MLQWSSQHWVIFPISRFLGRRLHKVHPCNCSHLCQNRKLKGLWILFGRKVTVNIHSYTKPIQYFFTFSKSLCKSFEGMKGFYWHNYAIVRSEISLITISFTSPPSHVSISCQYEMMFLLVWSVNFGIENYGPVRSSVFNFSIHFYIGVVFKENFPILNPHIVHGSQLCQLCLQMIGKRKSLVDHFASKLRMNMYWKNDLALA